MSYLASISSRDRQGMAQVKLLLEQEGITLDGNLDYTCGLFDEEDNQLLATGSCFGNTLRCLAVSQAHQGEGLLNTLISHLVEMQLGRGYSHLFLYTKCQAAKFFGDVGFYEIARVENTLVFLENRRGGFDRYLRQLKTPQEGGQRVGAIVMNANPFTRGHQYLVEQAAQDCDILHLFVVSEESSLVPFAVRKQLVEAGVAHLPQVICHETGPYLISSATFPSYFLKDEDTVITGQARLDLAVFRRIAETLHITHRYVGDEPFSRVTSRYNAVMQEELPKAGIECVVIPRKTSGERPISASYVRQCIRDGAWETVAELVPPTTLDYFRSPAAEAVIEAMRRAESVVHY